MGSEWLDSESGVNTIVVHESRGTTSHQDTRELVKILVNQGADLILYAGGDGTTRDLIQTLEENESATTPIVGIPCGVKMYSGCFASSPKAAAEVVEAWMGGDLLIASTEVLDPTRKLTEMGFGPFACMQKQ